MRENTADPVVAIREVNVNGTTCLAQQAVEAGVRRFVYLSSVKVNGRREKQRSEIRSEIREVSRTVFF